MADQDVILRNGTVLLESGAQCLDIHIHRGSIVALGNDLPATPTASEINARGLHVLPGIIDPHVHLREFGYSEREDFYTGTQAAAIGGVTTVFDMPNSKPNVITPDDFRARRDRVIERAYVNIALYVWACAKNAAYLDEFAPLGPIGFKVFTAETGAYDPEFAQYITTEPDTLFRILEKNASFGAVTAIHSESQSLVAHLERYAKTHMAPDLDAYSFSRPTVVEDVAVFGEVAIAKHCRAKIHICHVVGKGAVDFLRWAKRSYYANVSCECTPHNLLMNLEQARCCGSLAKFSPPVHEEEHRRALWEGLLDGTVDMVGSDHAPQDNAKKHGPSVWEAPPGSPALDYWVPLMLDRVASGEMSMNRFVEVTAKRPAEVFGLYPAKGSIRVGSDADLVVVDLARESMVDPTKFKSKAKYTPFAGWKLRGLPIMTFVGGTLVAKDGKIVGRPGCGSFVSANAAREPPRVSQTAVAA
jgi:dihydroorotase (multifunctional complex type)